MASPKQYTAEIECAKARFTYSESKGEKVMILSNGKLAKTLTGKEAVKFLSKIDQLASEEQAQLLMAKITGQFKFGNERLGKLSKS